AIPDRPAIGSWRDRCHQGGSHGHRRADLRQLPAGPGAAGPPAATLAATPPRGAPLHRRPPGPRAVDEAAAARPGTDRGATGRRRLRPGPGPAGAGQPHPRARPRPDAQPPHPGPLGPAPVPQLPGDGPRLPARPGAVDPRPARREPAYLKALEIEYGGTMPEPLAGRLAERSLADAHAAAGARLGVGEVPAWPPGTTRGGPPK